MYTLNFWIINNHQCKNSKFLFGKLDNPKKFFLLGIKLQLGIPSRLIHHYHNSKIQGSFLNITQDYFHFLNKNNHFYNSSIHFLSHLSKLRTFHYNFCKYNLHLQLQKKKIGEKANNKFKEGILLSIHYFTHNNNSPQY